MTFNDIVVLLNKVDVEKDKYGNNRLIFDKSSVSQAFCNVRDIGREEFYLGKNNRYKPSKVLTLRKCEYDEAQYIIIGNSLDLIENLQAFIDDELKIYKLIRTYTPSSLLLGRNEKKIIGAYKPGKDDVEIVVEVLVGTPKSEIKNQLLKEFKGELKNERPSKSI